MSRLRTIAQAFLLAACGFVAAVAIFNRELEKMTTFPPERAR